MLNFWHLASGLTLLFLQAAPASNPYAAPALQGSDVAQSSIAAAQAIAARLAAQEPGAAALAGDWKAVLIVRARLPSCLPLSSITLPDLGDDLDKAKPGSLGSREG